MKHPQPDRVPRAALTDGVPCPFCSGNETKLITPFGGQLSVAQYWCTKCRTGFDYLKWNGPGS